jgi:hypothetical protein
VEKQERLKRSNKANYVAKISAVERVINEWDPMGLLEMGAPQDEYHLEVEEISASLRIAKDDKALASKVQEIFYGSFNEESFLSENSNYLDIAKKILRAVNDLN